MFVLRLPSIGTVSSCSPLIPIRPLLSASPFPLFSFLICAFLCVSFVVSLAVSPCVSSHAFRCRCPSCRPSCRLIGSVHFACRLVWAPFRSAVRSFSSRLLERDCLTFPCRLVSHCFPFVSRLARRLVVASRLPSRLAHLVSVMSSRSRRPGGGCSCPFPCLFPCSRRSVLLVAHSCSFIGPGSSVSVMGEGRCVMKRRRLTFSRLIRLISFILATRSLQIGMRGGYGYGAPFHAARRSYPRLSYPHRFHISSDSIALICPHHLIHEAREPNGEDKRKREKRDAGETDRTRRSTRRGYDEDNTEDKQETRRRARRRHETVKRDAL